MARLRPRDDSRSIGGRRRASNCEALIAHVTRRSTTASAGEETFHGSDKELGLLGQLR